jgi:hypothetical protein
LSGLRDLVRLLRTTPLPGAISRDGGTTPAEAAKPAAMEVPAAPPPDDDPVLRALRHAETGRRRGERALALDRDLAQLGADALEIRFALRSSYLDDKALGEIVAAMEAARRALDRAKATAMKKESARSPAG